MEEQPQPLSALFTPPKNYCIISMQNPKVNPTKMVFGGKQDNTEFYRADQTDTHPKVYAIYHNETGDYGCVYKLRTGGKSAEEIRTMLDKRLPADQAFKRLQAIHKQQTRIAKTILKLEARKRLLKARYKQQQQETPSKKPRNKKRFQSKQDVTAMFAVGDNSY